VNSPTKERKDFLLLLVVVLLPQQRKQRHRVGVVDLSWSFFFVVRVDRSHTTTMAFGLSRAASDLRTFGHC
jgi:hypothetical protein